VKTRPADFKLAACEAFLAHGRFAVEKLQTDQFRPIVLAYNNNIDRARSVFLFPIFIAVFAMRQQRALDEAHFLETGSVYKAPENAEALATINRRAQELFREQGVAFLTSGSSETIATSFLDQGARVIHGLINPSKDDPVAQGIEQMFNAQILATWTAFETLVGDLWVAAVNAHPRTLADLAGTTKGRYVIGRGDRSEPGDSPASGDKAVKLSWLQRFGYDIADRMGTIHRERFSFDRLSGIRQAYAAAFAKNAEKIDKYLSDEVLDAVSQVRNAIVHRAGVADDEYVRRAQRLPAAPKVDAGQQIIFDGESFCTLMVPMLECVDGLIYAIDEWVTP
jgi:hypothetical protein